MQLAKNDHYKIKIKYNTSNIKQVWNTIRE